MTAHRLRGVRSSSCLANATDLARRSSPFSSLLALALPAEGE